MVRIQKHQRNSMFSSFYPRKQRMKLDLQQIWQSRDISHPSAMSSLPVNKYMDVTSSTMISSL